MGHRLTRLYTRTGDAGTTGLGDGRRVDKDHPRITAIGDIDELNSAIGLILAQTIPQQAAGTLQAIQQRLFDVGGELAMPGYTVINAGHISAMEHQIDALNQRLPPLQEFIMPGGSTASAHCHLARAICRRAERQLVTLGRMETVRAELLTYLNRLSDLLFATARMLGREDGSDETAWQSTTRSSQQP
ncbi:MAG: cob(I)yrinic acid a,c-diamide adenosyltransferase [Gammaproteobacteria bacterium]|nr:cob(I)yrinic acid a,c-diamide adenosyltransferase [Gammaproteobacteria bacterium]